MNYVNDMVKKVIMYARWVVGFACASLFVEGAGNVKANYHISSSASGDEAHTHSSGGVTLIAGEKLIASFAFENADYESVSVNLSVGDTVYNFTDVIDSDSSRYVGLSYLDVTSEMVSVGTAGTVGTVNVDFGEKRVVGTSGEVTYIDVTSRLGASIIRVSGLEGGDADYSYEDSSIFGNTDDAGVGSVSLRADYISDGMFVASGFTSNGSIVGETPSAGNTSYKSTYHYGVGSAGGSFGYISSFDSSTAVLAYASTGGASNAIAYAAWEVVAVPEPSQVSVVIALFTICFCAVRRRVA